MTQNQQKESKPGVRREITAFEVGRLLYEARIREAWGVLAQDRLDRLPYPRHAGAERAADHELAIAQATALLKAYVLKPVAD